uniref:Uncharacterized protein n=1 Tax=Anguilla anguilla TaxID=7936 RepID=A0A0E9WNN7_ANGAN
MCTGLYDQNKHCVIFCLKEDIPGMFVFVFSSWSCTVFVLALTHLTRYLTD